MRPSLCLQHCPSCSSSVSNILRQPSSSLAMEWPNTPHSHYRCSQLSPQDCHHIPHLTMSWYRLNPLAFILEKRSGGWSGPSQFSSHIVTMYTGWGFDGVAADNGLWAGLSVDIGVSAVNDDFPVHLSGGRVPALKWRTME